MYVCVCVCVCNKDELIGKSKEDDDIEYCDGGGKYIFNTHTHTHAHTPIYTHIHSLIHVCMYRTRMAEDLLR